MKRLLPAALALLGLFAYQATNIATSGTLPANCSVGNVYVKTGASAGFYVCLATDTWTQLTAGGSGDVSAAANIADNAIVRGDGGAKGVQESLLTISDAGVVTFPDGVKQTFNPDGTNAGINVGSQAGDPSSLANGDLWYDSTANELTARINGASVALGAGGGGAVGDLTDYQFVRKTGDESVTSSTALQDDDELLFAIGTSGTWIFKFHLAYSAGTTGDIKIAFNVPASATGRYMTNALVSTAASASGSFVTWTTTDLTDTGAAGFGGPGATDGHMMVEVIVVSGGTGGNVVLRWAQNTSNGTATIVRANSYLTAHKVQAP